MNEAGKREKNNTESKDVYGKEIRIAKRERNKDKRWKKNAER